MIYVKFVFLSAEKCQLPAEVNANNTLELGIKLWTRFGTTRTATVVGQYEGQQEHSFVIAFAALALPAVVEQVAPLLRKYNQDCAMVVDTDSNCYFVAPDISQDELAGLCSVGKFVVHDEPCNYLRYQRPACDHSFIPAAHPAFFDAITGKLLTVDFK